jgi:hypothetical protein
VPFDKQNKPAISDVTAAAIFQFESDNMTLSSEAIYQVNRKWEHFVSVPCRLLNGQEARLPDDESQAAVSFGPRGSDGIERVCGARPRALDGGGLLGAIKTGQKTSDH